MGVMSEETRTGQPAFGKFENVACPFCGMHCDDLTISVSNTGLKVENGGCPRATGGFERKLGSLTPTIAGKPATFDEAIAAAAKMVKNAKFPIYGGLGTDVDGMRATMALADKTCGVVDHALSEAQSRNFKVLQSTGWVMSTLTEARNRADLFIVMGSDVHKIHHRFFERIVCNEQSMFSESPEKRTVVFLGEGLDETGAVGSRVGDVISLPAKHERIGEIIDAMRAMHKGIAITADTVGGLPRKDVEDLVERIKKASYGIMVWAPPGLDFPNADLTVQSASEYIKEINLTTRFAGLTLGGNEGSASAASVCAWQAGFPLRVSFATGKPDYDPERYSLFNLIKNKEGDLLLWIASIGLGLTPPETDLPMIALATPGMKFKTEPAVMIPVGTSGIDHEGTMIRCDSVVSLPMRNLGRTDLPRVADVLAKIQAAI